MRNETFLRRTSMYSSGSNFVNKSISYKDPKLPGGAGRIPDDLNFGVFGAAIFEMSEEDDEDIVQKLKENASHNYNIYGLQNKKLLF